MAAIIAKIIESRMAAIMSKTQITREMAFEPVSYSVVLLPSLHVVSV